MRAFLVKALAVLAVVAIAGAAARPADAGTIIINNTNAANVGFNDPTARAPVGGNPGTTLGAQRLFIFNYAASIWGGILPDNVTITINASFAAQTCTATSATLGSTASLSSFRDFAGAPVAGHWYKQSLANKLANTDLDLARNDMQITFNLSIDSGCFGPGQVWYYGIDGNEGTNIELLPVVLHEIGHGLGFATLTSGTSGNYNTGFPDIYDKFLYDKANALHWDQNSAAQRVTSAVSVDKLLWDGPNGISQGAAYQTVGQARVLATGGSLSNTYMVGQDATFGASLTTPGVTGNVVLLTDDNGGGVGSTNPNDGCDNITNAAALAGNFALIDRGVCTFAAKCKAAQNAGAVGVIIVNNVAAGLPGMGGADPTITIPCIGISQADGNAIKANLGSGVTATIGRDATIKAGLDPSGRPKMYAPNPFVSGSSVSHWDVSLSPNALMEPAINNDLHDTVDMTNGVMRDIGWFPAYVGAQSSLQTICPSNPCVTVPVNIRRFDAAPTPMLGYSVTLQLGAGLSLCAGTSSITEGTYLSGSGATTFQIVDNGGGSYTVDGAVLGAGCGPTGSTGTLFNVAVTSVAPQGTGTITVTSVKLRNCNNDPLDVMPDSPGTVKIDNVAPVALLTSPNGGETWIAGSTHPITWTATDNVAVANVDLAYSTDGGATFPNAIATGIANSGSFAWTLPITTSTQTRVRVTAHDTGCSTGSDASDADFTIRDPIVTASAGANGSISPSGAVPVPYGTNQTFAITADPCYHVADVVVDGVSVGVTSSYTFSNVTTDHTISATFAGDTYTITASAGPGGSITPSGAVSVACGASQTFTIAADACHTIGDVTVDGSSVGAVSSYTFTNVNANHTIAASFAPNVAVVPAVTALAAAQQKTGNDADGTTKIALTFTAPGGTTVEVWRKGFGGYPQYDDAGGSTPPAPGSYPPAGWTLTGVTASGQSDEPGRDFWYYVAYAKDACGNVSPVSNRTNGTLGYHLGDVSDGVTPGQGDNSVNTVDLSLLGAHYGLSGAGLAGFEYLDVGPTTNLSVDARPTTDAATTFEDLFVFAINYTPRVSLVAKGGPVAQAYGQDVVSVGATDAVTAGQVIDVPVQLSGAGDLQGLSVSLRYDASVVAPEGVTGGDWFADQQGIVLSPGGATIDAALLGAGSGVTGEGLLATVRFRALAAGDPAIGVSSTIGRDANNGSVTILVGQPLAVQAVAFKTALQPVRPNPSRGLSTLGFSLASESRVDLSIYSVDGRKVRTIVNGVQPAGSYRFTWNGADDQGTSLKSGVYFVRFTTDAVKATERVMLVR